MLLPDGRIGFIDYGSTKRLTKNERISCCMLFAALARGDAQMLFDMSEIGGYKSKYGRKDVLLKLIQFGYDSYGKDVTGGKNIQQFIDELKVCLCPFLVLCLSSILGRSHDMPLRTDLYTDHMSLCCENSKGGRSMGGSSR